MIDEGKPSADDRGRKSTILLLLCALLLAGCGVSQFSGSTKATWTTPDGKTISYESNKDTVGLDATFDPITGKFHIKVDKAGTSEAAIAAAAEAMKANANVMQELIPLLQKAAAIAGTASTGVQIPAP